MKRILVWLTVAIIRLIGSSLRLTIEDRAGILGHPEHPPVIMAFWHNRTALMAYFCWRFAAPDRTILTFISLSRDGQFITDVAEQFGVTAIRGSSSRRGMIAALKAIRGLEMRAPISSSPPTARAGRATRFNRDCCG